MNSRQHQEQELHESKALLYDLVKETPEHDSAHKFTRPRAACSICGDVDQVQVSDRGVFITCADHSQYFAFYFKDVQKRAA